MTWTRFLSPEARDTIFDVLVHVVWADGRLGPDEVAAARGAASALGLSTQTLSGALLARAGRPFESLALHAVAPQERPFVYAAAAWISRADRRVTVSESMALDRIRDALAIPGSFAEVIESLARDERLDAHEAPEHALELERVMSSLVQHLTAAPSPLTPTEPPGEVRSSLADGRRR